MTSIAIFKVIASIYFQCAGGMVPDYPSTELRQSSKKTKQEKIRIPRCNFFENLELKPKIHNFKLTVNRSSKNGK